MKHILITGSTDGLGQLLALKLAKEGHHVYLHGRNPDKLAAVINDIKSQTSNLNIKGFVADFSDLSAVNKVVDSIINTIPQLDILINNAGIFSTNNPINAEKLDIRYVVNYLAPYVLTKKLLPLLNNGQSPRLINVSSAAQSPVSLAALQGKTYLDSNAAYAQSKLALTMWSFDLAKKLENEISVIAVNPGSLLNTKMANDAYGKHWSSADKGVNILYDLALSDKYEGITGEYFDNDLGKLKGSFTQAHPDAYNQQAITELLNVTENLVDS